MKALFNIKRAGTLGRDNSVPQLAIRKHVVCQIMCSIGIRKPEAGGILLGPVGTDDITDYYFDNTASCTNSTYTPDHVTLRRMMIEEWLPSGIDFKGFVHSHPGGFDRPSSGDLNYIGRLLSKNPDMRSFAAPIVIPEQFRLRAFIVLRERPNVPCAASLRFF